MFSLLVLPTLPRNISAAHVNQSSVELRWLPPAVTGDQTNVHYDVDCREPCDNDDDSECVDKECKSVVTYLPCKEGLNLTHVMVTDLSSFVNYTFKIYAKNRVSEVAKRRHGVEANFKAISVRTNGSSKFLSLWKIYNMLKNNYYLRFPANHLTHSMARTYDDIPRDQVNAAH